MSVLTLTATEAHLEQIIAETSKLKASDTVSHLTLLSLLPASLPEQTLFKRMVGCTVDLLKTNSNIKSLGMIDVVEFAGSYGDGLCIWEALVNGDTDDHIEHLSAAIVLLANERKSAALARYLTGNKNLKSLDIVVNLGSWQLAPAVASSNITSLQLRVNLDEATCLEGWGSRLQQSTSISSISLTLSGISAHAAIPQGLHQIFKSFFADGVAKMPGVKEVAFDADYTPYDYDPGLRHLVHVERLELRFGAGILSSGAEFHSICSTVAQLPKLESIMVRIGAELPDWAKTAFLEMVKGSNSITKAELRFLHRQPLPSFQTKVDFHCLWNKVRSTMLIPIGLPSVCHHALRKLLSGSVGSVGPAGPSVVYCLLREKPELAMLHHCHPRSARNW